MKNNANKIVIQTQTGSIFIKLDEIICCKGAGSYTELTLTMNRKVLSANLLKEFEHLLVKPDLKFIRLHRSFLVNLDFMLEYRNCSQKRVILTGPIEIPVAHRKAKEFLKLMKGHFLHFA